MEISKMPVLIALMISLSSASAHAWGRKIGTNYPNDATKFQGAFEGEQNGEAVDVIITPAKVPGSFIVSLIVRDSRAQLFYAELVDEKTIGLMALGLKADQSDIDDKLPPAGLMKIAVDRSHDIETIQITPQDGSRYLGLGGVVNLDCVSGTYGVSQLAPSGIYRDRKKKSEMALNAIDDNAWSLSGNIPSLGLSNDYGLTLALTGVGVLRSVAFEEYFQKKEQDQISALVINILRKKKPSLLVLKASAEGVLTSAAVLTLD